MTRRKRKVCVVVNSRANYGRIRSVMAAIQAHDRLKLQLIVGASALLHRFGMAIDSIVSDGFIPDATLYSIVEGETPVTMAKSTGLAIVELATLFENLRPDIVITVADRFETLATAVAASYMNIPLAHTQGGEITGSIDESVRHAITKLSHIHFPATEKAAEIIQRMGEDPSTIHKVGCPSLDVLVDIKMDLADDFFFKNKGVGSLLDPSRPYLVVLQHPVTTEFGDGLSQINKTLGAISRIQIQTVWLWPNVDAGSDDISKGLRIFRERNNPNYIHFYRNFEMQDYARMIYNCSCLIGNSSSAIREGSFLGVPAVNIGSRQQGRERSDNVLTVGYDSAAIENSVRFQIKHGRYNPSDLYGDGLSGKKIADILAKQTVDIQKRLNM